MKKCGRCLRIKDVSEFNKNKYSKTGYRSQCKECMKKERARLRDHYKEWRTTEERRVWYADYRKERYQKDKSKISARNKTNWAIKTGTLVRMPCVNCGAKAEAHHPDYDRPLDVVWLCPKHHKEAHEISKQTAPA